MLERIFNGFWAAKDIFRTKLGLGGEKPLLIEGAYFPSDMIFMLFLIRFVDLALSNLWTRSLIDKKLNDQDIVVAIVAIRLFVEVPFLWERLFWVRVFFIVCDLLVEGPDELLNKVTVEPVPSYSIVKRCDPIYLTKLQQHPGV